MKGLLVALMIAMVSGALLSPEEEMTGLVTDMWAAASRGDAEQYHACFTNDVQIVTNGELDEAPWGDLDYIKDLFSRVRYGQSTFIGPVAVAEDGSFFVKTEWLVTVLSTGEQVSMGTWSQHIVFNQQHKITQVTSVCDSAPLERFARALGEKADPRSYVQAIVTGFNQGDASMVASVLHPSFYMQRNGIMDPVQWGTPSSLQPFFDQAKWTVEIQDFSVASPDQALANLLFSVVADSGASASFFDGWVITLASNPSTDQFQSILAVASVVDTMGYNDAIILALPHLAPQHAQASHPDQ